MTISVFVGADDARGRRGFCVLNIEEPRRLHRHEGDYHSGSLMLSEGFSSRADVSAVVRDDRRAPGKADLWTAAPRERAVQETWGIPCLSPSRRSVRIRF